MTISDRDRKMLWGLARNQCSKCRGELVQTAQVGQSPVVVGEECHIISPRRSGPRGTADLRGASPDGYENLILLCPSDHALVDQLVDDYPPDRLRTMKSEHEAWVKTSRNAIPPAPLTIRRNAPAFLIEVDDGRTLLSLVGGCHESSLEHDNLSAQEEVDLVGGFLQMLFDTNDLWGDMELAWRIQTTFDVDQQVTALLANGWRVFAARARGTLVGGGDPQSSPWDTAYVRVVRASSPEIVRVGIDTSDGRTERDADGVPQHEGRGEGVKD